MTSAQRRQRSSWPGTWPTSGKTRQQRSQRVPIAGDTTTPIPATSGKVNAPAGAFTLPDVAGVGVVVALAPGERCERCWRVLPEVGHVPGHDDLCQRCAEVIDRGAGAGLPLAAAG